MRLKDYPVYAAKKVLKKWPKAIIRFFQYWGDYSRFSNKNDGRFTLKLKDAYPCLFDKTNSTPFDQHYTYHPAWAARKLAEIRPAYHVDISSILSFGTVVSAFIPVKFYDYRPAAVQLPGWESGAADLVKLHFDNDSIPSLSCMHTIEHIGLGRYGDEIDPEGDVKAINELKRVLQPGGNLLFVTPVGEPRIMYNAHRIYSFEQIIELFSGLELVEFSLIPDSGGLIEKADPLLVARQKYGCGCFWFRKKMA
jgi:SAM-dependent methyltransferase